jgi:hypothetical protein
MSAASDVTALRHLLAKYSVDSQAQNTWSTVQPISTSSTVTAGRLALSSQSVGTATLTGGTVTVTASGCTPNSCVFVTYKTVGGTQGILRTTPGNSSFVITSSSGSDTSIVQWMVVNAA